MMDHMNESVPNEIIESALKVSDYFESRDIKNFQIVGLKSLEKPDIRFPLIELLDIKGDLKKALEYRSISLFEKQIRSALFKTEVILMKALKFYD
jgi:hypothetical protein